MAAGDLYLDYSKNRLTRETVRLLAALAESVGLRERTEAMFRGEHVNATEDRAVLHVALRDPATSGLDVDGHDVRQEVHEALGVIAAHAPDLQEVLARAHAGALPFLCLDGTLIPTDRVAARAQVNGRPAHHLWYSGKHHAFGGTAPTSVDSTEPGAVQRARLWSMPIASRSQRGAEAR